MGIAVDYLYQQTVFSQIIWILYLYTNFTFISLKQDSIRINIKASFMSRIRIIKIVLDFNEEEAIL